MWYKVSLICLITTMTACGSAKDVAQLSSLAITDTPYAYSGNPFCWTDQIKTNGASYGLVTNSAYLCHTVGGGGLDGQTFYIGFYQNGTLSYQRRDGSDAVYTPSANPSNCHLGFDNGDHSLRYINLSAGILDANNYLTSSNQDYYTNPPTQTDAFPIACMFKSSR